MELHEIIRKENLQELEKLFLKKNTVSDTTLFEFHLLDSRIQRRILL